MASCTFKLAIRIQCSVLRIKSYVYLLCIICSNSGICGARTGTIMVTKVMVRCRELSNTVKSYFLTTRTYSLWYPSHQSRHIFQSQFLQRQKNHLKKWMLTFLGCQLPVLLHVYACTVYMCVPHLCMQTIYCACCPQKTHIFTSVIEPSDHTTFWYFDICLLRGKTHWIQWDFLPGKHI